MLFSNLSKYLEKLEKIASRNEITKILAEVLKEADRDEIGKVCYLLLGELLPSYRGVEFNLAEKMMIRALAGAYGKEEKEIAALYHKEGDLGNAAYQSSKLKAQSSKLSVEEVYDKLLEVAEDSGEGSQERKIEKMARLLAGLDPLSAKFVSRIPVGKLRLGFSDATLLDALSVMEKGDKSGRKEIERAYNVTADIGLIAERVKKGGLKALEKIEAEPGIPIRPALAERLQKIEELFEKAGSPVGVEQKLDGFRTQVHVWSEGGEKKISLFSRNLENTTRMFPEIAESARKLPAKSAILDGETIGYDPQTDKFAPFQETVQRKRKHDVEEFAKKIPLVIFVFDLLYQDGKSYLSLPFRERRKKLEELFGKKTALGAIHLAKQKETESPEEIQQMLEESLKRGLEGLVIKNLSLPYEAGSRGFHWIKLKGTSGSLERLRTRSKFRNIKISRLPDTIDCVVMGAYRGRGKRAKFGVGGFLLGVKGSDDRYYTISRLGSGLSDEQFREAKKRIAKLEVKEKPKEYEVDKDGEPHFWLRPKIVAEILADEITLSPRHTAGRKKEGERGYSLRFPRLVRFRDDKNPEDATTIREIEKMYSQQH